MNKITRQGTLALALLALGTTAANANPGPSVPAVAPVQPAAAAECELHVWGGERFQALTTSWLSGFGAIGGLVDAATQASTNEKNQAQLGEALSTSGQVKALSSADLPSVLRLAGYRVVAHDEPMDPKKAGRVRARHASSTSPCYAELMVTRLFYQKAAIYGRSLRASFLFREFGHGAEPTFTFAGRGGNGLKLFPPQNAADAPAANDELISVFKANLDEYARNLNDRRIKR